MPVVPGRLSRPSPLSIRSLHGNDDHHHGPDDHHHGPDDHHLHGHHDDHMPPPVVFPDPPHLHGSSPPPRPRMDVGLMKPKPSPTTVPKAKPKPKPKPKPEPKHKHSAMSTSQFYPVGEWNGEDLREEARQQCQMDIAQFCSSGNPIYKVRDADMLPSFDNSVFFDVVMVDSVTEERTPSGRKGGNTYQTDDAEDSDDDVDDNYYQDDDRSDEVDILRFGDIAMPPLGMLSSLLASVGFLPPSSPMVVPLSGFDDDQSSRGSLSVPMSRGTQPRMMVKEEEMPPMWNDGLDMMPPVWEDENDMCLQANFERLSPQCQDAIVRYIDFSDDVDNDEDMRCVLIPLVLSLLFLLMVLRCVARRRGAQRKDTLQTTLAAINANPELKAKVEAASGVPVPPPLPSCRAVNAGSRCSLARTEQPCYVRALGALGVLMLSLLIVLSSMLVTGAIVNYVYVQTEEPPSRVLVMLILFCVTTLLLLLARAIRALCAPTTAPLATASTGTSSSPNGGSRSSLPEIFHRMRAVQLSSLLPSSFSSSPSSSSLAPQYQPLLSDEDYELEEQQQQRLPADGAEMTVLLASAPPSTSVATTIPVVVAPAGYARPNVQSTISML